MSASPNEFPLHVLKALESFFEEGRIETLVRPPSFSEPLDVGVKIIDSKTGAEYVEGRFQSQIENKAVALLTLLCREKNR